MAANMTALTAAERGFLRQLFVESAARQPLTAADAGPLRLESPGIDSERLLRMLAGPSTELTATDGRYRLRFGVEWQADPQSGALTVRLLQPTVTDRLGAERRARVRPEPGEALVRDLEGGQADLRVLNLSDTGMALAEAGAPAQAHQLRELELSLAGEPPISVSGRVVRIDTSELRSTTVAVEFENLPAGARETLRRYVLRRYQAEL